MKRLDNESIWGGMPPHIDALVANALKTEAPPMKRKSFAAILLTAILLLALACTALALTLSRSAESIALGDGRKALMAEYGFTDQSLGMFTGDARQTDTGWVITYSPIPTRYARQLGTYVVILEAGEAPDIRWSHKAVDLAALEEAGPDSSVWGPKQIEAALALDQAYMEKSQQLNDEKGDMLSWSLEDYAELDSIYADAGHSNPDYGLHILPAEDEVQPEEALKIAREAIEKKYGKTEADLEGYAEQMQYIQNQGEPFPYYWIQFIKGDPMDYTTSDSFSISLDGKLGTVRYCYWNIPPERFRLPDGPLDEYYDAVQEFLSANGMKYLSHEERAELQERIEATGIRAFMTRYAAPGDGDIPEDEAIRIVKDALHRKYGLTDDMLGLFDWLIEFRDMTSRNYWHMQLTPKQGPFDETGLDHEIQRLLGYYDIHIKADTGYIEQIEWNMESIVDSREYDETNWAQAPALRADLIPLAMAFEETRHAYLEAHKTDLDEAWTPKVQGEYYQLYRDAGFDPEQYSWVVPGKDDIPEDKAVELALLAFSEEYDVMIDTLKTYRVYTSFHEYKETGRLWSISLYTNEPGAEDSYWLEMSSPDGEIMTIQYTVTGNG